jgi:hypothetical protein
LLNGELMMRWLLIGAATALVCIAMGRGCAMAQQMDPRVETYRFLLNEANGRLADANAQAAALQIENAQLKADLAKLKADKKE